MTGHPISDYRRHRNMAQVMMTLALTCFVAALIMLSESDVLWVWAIIPALLTMILGGYGFDHFGKAAELKPAAPMVRSLELAALMLKNGTQVDVVVQLIYPSEQDLPHTLDRIKIQLMRILNEYCSEREALSADPYAEIDDLLQRSMEPLRRELQLDKISVQTIDAKMPSKTA